MTLAAQQPTAFHDVTSGTIAMPCATGTPNCTTTTPGHAYGVLNGYNAGAGYDLATGLGSVDANNLVTKWNLVTLLPSVTTLSSLTPTTITHGETVNFSASVAAKSGTGATPTGLISLAGSPTNSSQGIAGFSLVNGAASGSTDLLPGGTYSVTAHYPGDSAYGPSDSAPITVTVGKENSQPQLFLETFDSNGNLINGNASTAVYGSPYLIRVNVENAAAKMCSPVATSGATGCPTGNVTLTNNGTALDAGKYALNSYGYFDDFAVQLPGGTNMVKAAYGGDESFNGSSATSAITITPTSTWVVLCCNYNNFLVGQTASVTADVGQGGTGVSPTGTVSFWDNGASVGSAPTTAMGHGSTATVSFPLATPGPHNITATYNGDSNYFSSSAPGAMVDYAYYTTTTSISADTVNPAAGASVALTVLIDTSTNSYTPTGTPTINAGYGSPLPGKLSPTTVMQTTDASGYSELRATANYTPHYNTEIVYASYPGDADFSFSSSPQQINIKVAGDDFLFYAGGGTLSMSAGQQGEVSFVLDGQLSYSGTVNFTAASCSGLPAEASCSFQPASLTGSGSVSTFVSTTGPSSGARDKVRASIITPEIPLGLALLGGLFILSSPSPRRRPAIFLGLLIFAILIGLPSCGGGNSSGGGGGGGAVGGTPPGTYNVTVTAATGSLSHTANFTLVIQ